LVSFLRQYRMPVPRELDDPRKHVLIVDDEPAMVRMLEHALSSYEGVFTHESTLSGYAALLRIGERKPDLVILDVMMPEIDGWAVIDLLKASPATRGIKVLVISGAKPRPSARDLARHTVDAFLEKPFPPEDLLAAVSRLLGVALPQPSAGR
jgi:CheY-like chemotaxis protein